MDTITIFNEFAQALGKVINYPRTEEQAAEYNDFFKRPMVAPGATKKWFKGYVTGNRDGSVTYRPTLGNEAIILVYGPDPLDFCRRVPGYQRTWELGNAGFADEQRVILLLKQLKTAIENAPTVESPAVSPQTIINEAIANVKRAANLLAEIQKLWESED